VLVDVLLDTFGSSWLEVRHAARTAERAGLDGVWLNDHLAGSVEGAPHVLECWTVLSALAAEVPRLKLGTLVLNVANRDPGTLAVMAATLQQISGGRLLLGLGAGAGPGNKYATEQQALGRPEGTDADRRRAVERTIAILHEVWSGEVPPARGFLRPEPVPPIVIAVSGPKTAELAGLVGDGICVPAGSRAAELVAMARHAYDVSGRDPQALLVTILISSFRDLSEARVGPGVDRLIVNLARPFDAALAGVTGIVSNWRGDSSSSE
jgi:alkanesulfonate monooxygenase SsuD/methylene tetrahydromethanopterin reductase-like flavin-dependent oxidoreductase (luciferase family)